MGMLTGKWAQPRQAIRDGKVVFFPRTSKARVWSILSWERKLGMRIKVETTDYQECPGVVVWRVN